MIRIRDIVGSGSHTCAIASGEICASAVCQTRPDGLVFKEIHFGNPNYFVLENRGSDPVDLSRIYYRYSDGGGQLPVHILDPGQEVYFLNRRADKQPGDLTLPFDLPSFTSAAEAMLLCVGPCSTLFADNALDVFIVSLFNQEALLPPGITFSPQSFQTIQPDTSSSYIRSGDMGRNPTFLQSDWSVGPASR